MMRNKFKDKIRDREVALGTLVFTPSPTIIELLGRAGFDFAIIDTEHAPMSPYDMTLIENMVRAAQISDIVPLVRIPKLSRVMTQKVLDAGAQGIMVSGIRTKDDAIQAVKNSKYPPEGNRGCCYLTRPAGYSAAYDEGYWALANQYTIVAPLLENKEAVDNIEEIVVVEGLDYISFGPRDFSMSLGYTNTNNPETIQAREHIEKICRNNNVPMDRFLYPPFDVSVKKAIEDGSRILIAGADVGLFVQICKKLVNTVEEYS